MNNIDTSGNLVPIATHLTREEADSIKSGLTAMNIDYVVNEHHATSMYNSLYYEIKVKKKDRKNSGTGFR